MKKLRVLGVSSMLALLLYAAWSGGYNRGRRETEHRESKAWTFLIASGRLDGLKDRMHRWADEVSADDVNRIASDYRSDCEHFIAAAAKVTEQSRAHSLVEDHTRGKMKPEEFESILREYQNEARRPGAVDATKPRVAE